MPDAFLYFYSAAAQLSVVLLGFWWAVITLKRDEWLLDAARRRVAYYVTLHFLVTGVGSLVSILAAENSAIWRVAFGAGGAIGFVAALLIIGDVMRRRRGAATPVSAYSWALIALVYAAAAVVAIGGTPLVSRLGFDATAILIEGVLVAVLLFLGAQATWSVFVESWTSTEP